MGDADDYIRTQAHRRVDVASDLRCDRDSKGRLNSSKNERVIRIIQYLGGDVKLLHDSAGGLETDLDESQR